MLPALLCLVVAITDGDTLKVRCGEPGTYQEVKVRLAEIDAPESRQPFGQRSKQHLSDLCFDTMATIQTQSIDRYDRYGRTVARVTCGGVDANADQVRVGMAWSYTQYARDPIFPQLEQQARAGRVGLWVDLGTGAEPVAPWEWRKAQGGRDRAIASMLRMLCISQLLVPPTLVSH